MSETQLSPTQTRAMNNLPLHMAARARDEQRREAAIVQKADPSIRPLLPIVLALARIAAVEDLSTLLR